MSKSYPSSGTEVAAGGWGVRVAVGGMGERVAVGGAGEGVAVGGTGVAVAVGGAGVWVGSGVFVGVSVGGDWVAVEVAVAVGVRVGRGAGVDVRVRVVLPVAVGSLLCVNAGTLVTPPATVVVAGAGVPQADGTNRASRKSCRNQNRRFPPCMPTSPLRSVCLSARSHRRRLLAQMNTQCVVYLHASRLDSAAIGIDLNATLCGVA